MSRPRKTRRQREAKRAARKLAKLQKLAKTLGVPFAHNPEPLNTHGHHHPAPFHRC